MVSFSSVALLALAYVSCLVNAIPLVGRDTLDVADPPITSPTKGAVWKAGDKVTVTWDISTLPAQITNPTGKIVLGWLEGDGLNLQNNAPLAAGFPITAGKVDITVPSQYPDRDTYIIALMGSSGNISPTFTITGGSSNPSSSSASSPADQPSSVPGGSSSTTPGSGSSVMLAAPSPTPTPSNPSSVSSLPPSSKSSTSPTPSGSQESSNGGNGDKGSAWNNKPANTMIVSLFVASLVLFF